MNLLFYTIKHCALHSRIMSHVDLAPSYNSQEDSDIRIKLGDRYVYCHKVIIKNASPMIKASMSIAMREVSEGVLEFREINPKIAERVLMVMYGIKMDITPLNREEIWELLMFIDMLQMDKLLGEVLLVLGSVEAMTIIDLIQIAHRYNDADILNTPIHNLITTADIQTLHDKFSSEINMLSMEEYLVFRNKWSEFKEDKHLLLYVDCLFAQANGDNEYERRDILSQLITNVDFTKFTINDLKNVLEYPVVKDDPIAKHILKCYTLTAVALLTRNKK